MHLFLTNKNKKSQAKKINHKKISDDVKSPKRFCETCTEYIQSHLFWGILRKQDDLMLPHFFLEGSRFNALFLERCGNTYYIYNMCNCVHAVRKLCVIPYCHKNQKWMAKAFVTMSFSTFEPSRYSDTIRIF